jgi:hypothetical protein
MSRRNRLASVIAGQQREAWEYERPPKFLIFDGDAKFSADVVSFVKQFVKQNGTEPVRTAFQRPWQNDLLDHVIAQNAATDINAKSEARRTVRGVSEAENMLAISG